MMLASLSIIYYLFIYNSVDMFVERVTRMHEEFLKLGYDRTKLWNVYERVVKKYDLQGKYGVNCSGCLD